MFEEAETSEVVHVEVDRNELGEQTFDGDEILPVASSRLYAAEMQLHN